MRLLLDTHVWLWLGERSPHLTASVLEAVTDPANEAWVSVVSLWEVVVKHTIGKLTLREAPATLWRLQVAEAGLSGLDLRAEHVLAAEHLPMLHRDPFDRMLVAQARAEGLTLVTADALVRAYPVATLDASPQTLTIP